ncbi:MAG: putative sulfate exporter family transporter [Bowdeniella nasicola]|nr:putative sulfate exporter family transporter [Bowdeniella nasicola]
MTRFLTLLPGLALAALATALAFALNALAPLLSVLLVAIILGVIARNTGLIREAAEPGLALTGRTILRAGVVLLGLRLSIPEVLDLGWGVIVVIVLTVVVTYLVTMACARALKLGHSTAVLTATGTAICGAAAVAAMTAVLPEDEEDPTQDAAATAVAAVTLFGTIGLLAIPALAGAIGLGAEAAGVWIGAAIHEVGQVVAGAGIGAQHYADAAGTLTDTALVTKLGRVVLLAPLVAIIGALEANRRRRRLEARLAREEVDAALAGRPVDHTPVAATGSIVPAFVLGFLAMVILRSLLPVPTGLLEGADLVATLLLTAAMFAMGAGVRVRRLVDTGGRALALGAIAAVASAALSLGAILLLV